MKKNIDELTLIAIDQSLTGTGIVVRRGKDDFDFRLLSTEREKERKECPVCGKKLLNPSSKSHRSSQYHKNELEKAGLTEDDEEALLDLLDKNDTPCIDNVRRIMHIRDSVEELCVNDEIDYAIIEGMAFGSRGRGKFDLGGLFHSITQVFLKYDIPFAVISPPTAKKFWTGSGNASKEEMIAETKDQGIEIPFDFDDNCNDAFVFMIFLMNLLQGNLTDEYTDKIETTWKRAINPKRITDKKDEK